MMRTWSHPYNVYTKEHQKLVCHTCGWMLLDHKAQKRFGLFTAHRECPELTLPGYPLYVSSVYVSKDNWFCEAGEKVTSADFRIKDLECQVNEVSKWNATLQKERGEQDFRINNLLDQNNKATHEACSQQRKIKDLELQVESSKHGPQCCPTRIRLEDRIKDLETVQKQSIDWRFKFYEKEKEILELRDQLNDWQTMPSDAKLHQQNEELKKKIEDIQKFDATFVGDHCASEKNILKNKIKNLESELQDAKKKMNVEVIFPKPFVSSEEIADALKECIGRKLAYQWQPINTAPKDGTQIILWMPFHNSIVTVVWDQYATKFIEVVTRQQIQGASHWMYVLPFPEIAK